MGKSVEKESEGRHETNDGVDRFFTARVASRNEPGGEPADDVGGAAGCREESALTRGVPFRDGVRDHEDWGG